MHDQISDGERERRPSTVDVAESSALPQPEPGRPSIAPEDPTGSRRSTNGHLEQRPISQAKQRGGRVWLREVVGWGGFLILIGVFFAIQNYLNGVLSGAANQIAMVMTVFLEIGLIWFWDRIWY